MGRELFNHIHHALSQVHELRGRVYENQLFRGYSWKARAGGALVAALGWLVLSSDRVPKTVSAHAIGWGAVCAIAVLVNYGALTRWYVGQDEERRELQMLRPVLDALPAFSVGGLLTLVMLLNGGERWLFGIWMAIFGLMHTSSRHSLPPEIWWLGWYYIGCSAWFFLMLGARPFTEPFPMGLVFVVGEIAGSIIFYRASKKEPRMRSAD